MRSCGDYIQLQFNRSTCERRFIDALRSNDLLAAPLILIRAKESLYPLGSTILILMLHPNGCVRYPTVEAEDAKLRVSGCAVRLPHVGVYPRQSSHDALNSVATHSYQQVASRSFC